VLPISILVVDDQPSNVVALEAALAGIDCRLVKAHSGRGALRCLLGQDFAVIVLDIHMPELDGFETARLIRARDRSQSTPIIFLTADDRTGERVLEGYRLGAVDYIYKPYAPEVLRAKVAVFVDLFRKTAALEEQAAELVLVTAALVQRKRQAEAALAVRDEFIAIAAHELRTPVTGIKVNAQLALRRLGDAVPDKERTARYLLGIVGGTDRLALLISDLMDVTRMRSGELLLRLLPIDLSALVSTVALGYVEAGGVHHHVTISLPGVAMMVAGDAGRLEQILDNLLSNAVKYSPAGGEIGITLRQAVDGGVVLTVCDSGIGLTPGAQERIFEPFGRAANARQQELPGMGLGLHICQRIAEAHGGRIWADSDGEDQGMTVSMWLPAA
jgi:signal transduction histidine kinase